VEVFDRLKGWQRHVLFRGALVSEFGPLASLSRL
jgi:hypothetical protein